MTERKIDASYVDRLVRDEALHSLGELCKSLIADGERLDWLEECAIKTNEEMRLHSLGFYFDEGKTLRQAVDERRKP